MLHVRITRFGEARSQRRNFAKKYNRVRDDFCFPQRAAYAMYGPAMPLDPWHSLLATTKEYFSRD
jgi:hypothetical protein